MADQELSEYVTIISNDGFEFIIKRDAANVAGTIRKMLDPTSNFAEASSGRCATGQFKYALDFPPHFPPLPSCTITRHLQQEHMASTDALVGSGVVIEKLCEYLYYNLKHKDAKDVPDMEIPPNMCLELLVAADYFDV
ncbi:MAG: hypothetical protein LQ338_002645 [Usnochroma carphineum]|nr:MAG: hypothetical protein LQ338_002645 [Usnochroma carphineum]